MNISTIQSHLNASNRLGTESLSRPDERGNTTEGSSFSKMLERSLNDVDEILKNSDKKMTELAVGKSENLHDAMIAFEKADVAFKLLVQVRNKAMDAYHEILRMQV